ncbi:MULTISPECIES: CsbD family protein [unclassified Thioalkalivibrio]|uniref:CsbD family protein n=1 Tax=unclassified Thioalkalivibrio TaxID=2621013 RepID=UPI0004756669|nr:MULTISPECIES: CsbD family protein [unclassified Thioalkalivibrio]
MNRDQMMGRSERLKARLKQEWGRLTDDEVVEAEGNVEELAARIREKYGDSREKIAARINELMDEVRNEDNP